MNLCQCGCGKELKSFSVKYIAGHSSRDPNVRNKRKQTCLLKYGCEEPTKSKIVREKTIKTNINRYGGISPYSSNEVRRKGEKTCLINNGINNVFKDKEKIKQSYQIKFGVSNPSKLEEVKKKKKDTCLLHFGFDSWSKTKTGRYKARLNRIKSVETQHLNGEPLMPNIGVIERECLNELQKHVSYSIERNKFCFGYYLDGYVKELNLVIEFDEPFHYIDGKLTERDVKRQDDIINKLQCKFFRIKQFNWINTKGQIINQFKELINESNAHNR